MSASYEGNSNIFKYSISIGTATNFIFKFRFHEIFCYIVKTSIQSFMPNHFYVKLNSAGQKQLVFIVWTGHIFFGHAFLPIDSPIIDRPGRRS